MKTFIFLSILFCAIALPALGQLTDADLDKIRLIVNVTYGLIALIVVAIGIPAWRGKRDREQERKIDELTREIETLKENYGKNY